MTNMPTNKVRVLLFVCMVKVSQETGSDFLSNLYMMAFVVLKTFACRQKTAKVRNLETIDIVNLTGNQKQKSQTRSLWDDFTGKNA